MARYRALPPVGYNRPRRTMEDIYQWYRKGLLFYGPYRTYFSTSKKPFNEYIPKAQSGEHRPVSEPDRKEQHNEIQPTKIIETKPESSQKIEVSQKLEDKKETVEKQNETSPNEKIGLPEYQENKIEQTTITSRKRPSPYYDRAETRW